MYSNAHHMSQGIEPMMSDDHPLDPLVACWVAYCRRRVFLMVKSSEEVGCGRMISLPHHSGISKFQMVCEATTQAA